MLAQVARRLGHGPAFPYREPAEIFAEHAALSGRVAQDFDLSAVADLDYESLAPFQWGGERPFADGRFFTADGRAALRPGDAARRPPPRSSPDFPLLLSTGRYRDQWHTMTRTGLSARLAQHRPEPLLELHPRDAQRHGVADGGLARVASPHGAAVLRVRVTDDQLPGTAFAPLHWNAQTASQGRIDALVAPFTDPISGQPEFKATPVAVRPFRPVWHGFALLRREPELAGLAYWARARVEGGWSYELAGDAHPDDWSGFTRRLVTATDGEWLELRDEARGLFRAVLLCQGQIEACLLVGDDGARTALIERFAGGPLERHERAGLLSGATAGPDPGPLVCACFGVGRNRIRQAIADEGLRSPDAIGRALKAGTNCGSCQPELQALIAAAATGA